MQLVWALDDEPLDPLLEPPELATGATPESEPPPPPPQLRRHKTAKLARHRSWQDISSINLCWAGPENLSPKVKKEPMFQAPLSNKDVLPAALQPTAVQLVCQVRC